MSDLIPTLAREISSAWLPPFRGEIYEYAAKLDLQKGYAVRGRFDIATALHLVEPLKAIRDPSVRLVSIGAAVQTLKSLIADMTVPYWIEHDPGDILWLFEDDPKAKLYAETRAMPLINSVPEIARMFEGMDRHDKTKTRIKFKHMNLVLAGLNLGNVQSISYRYVIIDEAWMARANGLIWEAKDRTKQYPDTKKIIILGQGGLVDEDADKQHKETDQRELTYACPHCGFRQPFDLSRERPAGQTGPRYSGLSWDTNDTTRPGGRWHFDAVGLTAHYICYQCGRRIEDTPTVRQQLAESYQYVITNPGAPAGQVGFWWPAEASLRIPWSDLVVKYLSAKISADEMAYRLPLQQFYQKDRGRPWSDNTGTEIKRVRFEPYEIKSDWPAEAYRPLLVDCQRDLQQFHYQLWGVALDGEARMYDRGTVDSFKAVADIQAKAQVRDQHVFLDCGFEMTKVLRECVKHGHLAKMRIGGKLRTVWICWTGLKGSGQEIFVHIHPKTKVKEFRIYSERKFYDVSLGARSAEPKPVYKAPWYEWSNLHAKDLLRARRDGDPNAPKFRLIEDKEPSTNLWSLTNQLHSETREETYEGGKKRAIWRPVSKNRPNHDWDLASMLMVFMAIAGIVGGPETDESPDP